MIRQVNGANCLCLGEGVVQPELGCQMADAFISAEFKKADGVPPPVLDFWEEARNEMMGRGEVAAARELETL
jgi:ribose 5-phosphate isomerase RpiB